MSRKPSLASAPIYAMERYFGLTAEQKKRVAAIQKRVPTDRPTSGAPGASVAAAKGTGGITVRRTQMAMTPEQMRGREERTRKIQKDQEHAAREIEQVLTAQQRSLTASFLRDLELFQSAFLPAALIKDLALNQPQKQKIQAAVQGAREERDHRLREALSLARQSGQFSGIGSVLAVSKKEIVKKTRILLTPNQRLLVENWEKKHPAPRS